jgi:DNA topoisomerase-1
MFNEITKSAIQQAMSHPGEVDLHRVHAQQARRILDRLVGYQISPILWKKVKRGISAGRVQSVALRMVVEREQEIQAFISEDFWTFNALLRGHVPPSFQAKLIAFEDEKLRLTAKRGGRWIQNAQEANDILQRLQSVAYTVADLATKARKQSPPVPFTTSKLQQEASRKLSYPVKKTMQLAQRLYEGVEIKGEPVGLITYMRTDSVRVSEDAITQARQFIEAKYDARFLPKSARRVQNAKGKVQDGHEAIRPTNVSLTPEAMKSVLNRDEYRLYDLIWKRFVASQMASREMDETIITVTAGPGLLEARGVVTTFPGFTVLWQELAEVGKPEEEKAELPALTIGETLKLEDLQSQENTTKPPPRYTEASLVKALEENGIGRPSTYATIISTIQNRDYVQKRENKFFPTDLGMIVTELLVGSFSDLMDIQYTAKMEDELDDVETGERTWQDLLRSFYAPFAQNLTLAESDMPDLRHSGLPTDIPCETCGKPTVIKNGKYGQFLSCSDYPNCTFAKPLREIHPDQTQSTFVKGLVGNHQSETHEDSGEPCPECTEGRLVQKEGRFGPFLACSRYPDCRYIHKPKLGVPCPEEGCTGELVERKSKRGKVFFGCDQYPKCQFASWDRPLNQPCPQCGASLMFLKENKAGKRVVCAKCGHSGDASTAH